MSGRSNRSADLRVVMAAGFPGRGLVGELRQIRLLLLGRERHALPARRGEEELFLDELVVKAAQRGGGQLALPGVVPDVAVQVGIAVGRPFDLQDDRVPGLLRARTGALPVRCPALPQAARQETPRIAARAAGGRILGTRALIFFIFSLIVV